MAQLWNVIWYKDGVKKIRRGFRGDKPRESGAIDFGKKLKARGIVHVYVVSSNHGFAPPLAKATPPQAGMLWCPYCLAWREFVEQAIVQNGLHGPAMWRCPICTISIHDYYVRKYNEVMVSRLDSRVRTQIPSEKEIKKAVNNRR